MRKTIYLLLGIIVIVITVLFLLLQFSTLPNLNPNGFTRRWHTKDLVLLETIPTSLPLENICGSTKNNFFFTVPNPQWIIRMDKEFKRQDTLGFGLILNEEMMGAGRTMLDSPWVYYFSGNFPAIFRGKLGHWELDTLYKPTNTFTRSAFISPDRVLLRQLDDSNKKQCFQIINLQTRQQEVKNDLFASQTNAGFETDGLLEFDSSTNRILYVEIYRNKFYCFDTALNVLYQGYTIDTFAINAASMKIVDYDGEKRLTPTSPRTIVNGDIQLANGYLYVTSKLKADNESHESFKKNAVIDMYEISNGKYAGSFYIPLIKGEKLKSYTIQGDLLTALYRNQIAKFKIEIQDYL